MDLPCYEGEWVDGLLLDVVRCVKCGIPNFERNSTLRNWTAEARFF